jgi:hypothetical protein
MHTQCTQQCTHNNEHRTTAISRSAAVIQSRGATFHTHHCDSLQTCNYLQISTFVNAVAHHHRHTAHSATGLVSDSIPHNSSDGSPLASFPARLIFHNCVWQQSVCLSLCIASILITFFPLVLRLDLFNWHVWSCLIDTRGSCFIRNPTTNGGFLLCTVLADRFLKPIPHVFTARYELNL